MRVSLDALRITKVRVVIQAFSLLLFLFFCYVAEFGRLKGYPVSLFLQVDPLVALATAISTHALYRELVWSLWLILPTLLLGRVFCNWLCPFGSIHQLVGWLANRRTTKARIESNRYRALYAAKYYLLAGLLGAALFTTMQIGLLDPICLLHRSFNSALLPAADMPAGRIYAQPHVQQLAWVVGFLFILFVGMNLAVPRFFCRALCPLGAMLGVLSRFSLWRVERDPERCTGCGQCLKACEGACDPHASLRKAECLVCMNCVEDCPQGALSFRFLPPREHEAAAPDASTRRALLAGFAGVLFYPFARASGKSTIDLDKRAIRPPGSVPEPDFLARCVKCDQCARACPTNAVQPAFLETGIEGLWTPILNMRTGYCEAECVLCGQVCPTGAIQRLTLPQKLGVGEFEGNGPVKVGTAFYDRGRCLPWAMDTPCVVCQEVCPTSPKAIYTREVTVTDRYGKRVTLQRPYVDPRLCTGCGVCEHECPVKDERAIRVTPAGETRSPERRLLPGTASPAPGETPASPRMGARPAPQTGGQLVPQPPAPAPRKAPGDTPLP